MTIPAVISSTTAGSRSPGRSPMISGAAKAIAATASKPVNDTSHEQCGGARVVLQRR